MNGLVRELKVGSKHLSKETVARANKYIVLTGDDQTDYNSIIMLEMLRLNVLSGTSNDITKYNMCESYRTSMILTLNARALQNLLTLRTSKATLAEFRDLAYMMYELIPKDMVFLFEDTVNDK